MKEQRGRRLPFPFSKRHVLTFVASVVSEPQGWRLRDNRCREVIVKLLAPCETHRKSRIASHFVPHDEWFDARRIHTRFNRELYGKICCAGDEYRNNWRCKRVWLTGLSEFNFLSWKCCAGVRDFSVRYHARELEGFFPGEPRVVKFHFTNSKLGEKHFTKTFTGKYHILISRGYDPAPLSDAAMADVLGNIRKIPWKFLNRSESLLFRTSSKNFLQNEMFLVFCRHSDTCALHRC